MLSGIFFLYHNAGDVILEFRLAETAWRNLPKLRLHMFALFTTLHETEGLKMLAPLLE